MTATPRLTFGRERRIRKRAEFLHIQSVGRRVTCRHFTLLVAAQRLAASAEPVASGSAVIARGPSRLGVVVTRKLGGAVQRNRIKRVCRECFRLTPDLVPPGIDLVVIARPGAERLKLVEVAGEWDEIRRILRKRAEEALAHAPTKHHLSSAPGLPRAPHAPRTAPKTRTATDERTPSSKKSPA